MFEHQMGGVPLLSRQQREPTEKEKQLIRQKRTNDLILNLSTQLFIHFLPKYSTTINAPELSVEQINDLCLGAAKLHVDYMTKIAEKFDKNLEQLAKELGVTQ